MKLVNITDRNVYNSTVGNVAPGRTTPDTYKDFCNAMQDVLDMCGKRFGIILNDSELALLEKIVSLYDLGSKFDVNSIPAEVRNDPLGKKRASEMVRKSQSSAIEAERKANKAAERREAVINGEIDERPRKPVGPATMEGEKVKPDMLKSGFEAILAENERIAAGKGKEHASVQEMLDPVGAHMKKNAAKDPAPAENDGTGLGDAKPVRQARDLDGNAVRIADAELPAPEVSERASAMDRQASDIARKLSTIGPEIEMPQDTRADQEAPGEEPAGRSEEANAPAEQAEQAETSEPEHANQDNQEKPAKKSKGNKSGVKKGKGRKGA